jgi:hypothetical protein
MEVLLHVGLVTWSKPHTCSIPSNIALSSMQAQGIIDFAVKKEIKAIKIAIILQETIFNMPGKFLLVVIQNDVVSFTLRLSAATTQFELDKKVGHGIPMKVWMINAFLDMNVITWVRIGSAVGEAVAVILSHLGVSKSIIEKLSQATVAVSNTNVG